METFKSIQGEGKYAGVPQVFVRFFECNMHCSWCDTPNSIGDKIRNFKEYDCEELFDQVMGLWDDCHSVSLTGGEPLLQADFMSEFLTKMKRADMVAYLETNGVLPEELKKVIDRVDIVAMDLKLPSSTQCRAYWPEHARFLKIAKEKDVFIKTVITNDTTKEDVLKSARLIADIDREILCYIQPNYFELKNGVMEKCLEYQKDYLKLLTNVRILPQTHKMMKLR